MIRRQFLMLLGQLSILGFVFKGHTEELVSSDLAPRVESEAVIEFEQHFSLSSAPLSTGPLCGPSFVRSPK